METAHTHDSSYEVSLTADSAALRQRLREAEAALRRAEERSLALARAGAQISWTARPNGQAADLAQWRAYTGQTRDAVRGWGWLDAIHADDRTAAREAWSRAVATRADYEAEYRLRRADGVYRPMLARAVPVLEADGRLCEWAGCCTDLFGRTRTERPRLDAALDQDMRDSAARAGELDAIFDSIPDGIIFYDAEGRIVRANSLACEFLGMGAEYDHYARQSLAARQQLYDPRDESGQPMPAERWPEWRVLNGERLAGAQAEDLVVRSPDGRQWQLSVSGTPLRDAAGRQTGAVCVFRDVTERRRLERRTQETQEALLALARDMARAPEMERDDEARILGTTDAMARRLLDLTRGLLGCQRVVMTTIDVATGQIQLLAAVGLEAEAERFWREELLNFTLATYLTAEQMAHLAAGQVVVVEATAVARESRPTHGAPQVLMAPLLVGARLAGLLSLDFGRAPHVYREEDRALASAVGQLAAVVLERERLLRERAAAHAKALALQEANRRMDTFMMIASHELRTPMTSVKANIQMAARTLRAVLEGGGLPDGEALAVGRASDLLTRADRQFLRQNRLVGDLLDVAQLRAGRLELRRERVDLAELVRDLLDEQRLANPEREITSALDAGPLLVLADPDRVAQVLFNYLSNALKYSEEARPVSVWLHVRGRMAKVSVRDRGLGLPPEEQGRIWKRFYRVESIKEQSGSSVGLGLGLFLSRQIVEQHGGQVGVRSAPGKGATFWFSLPLLDGGGNAPTP